MIGIQDKIDTVSRQILSLAAMNADWLPVNGELHTGDIIGFDIDGKRIRAEVSFTARELTVRMISPVQCEYKHTVHISFFSRPFNSILVVDSPEGAVASQECMDRAREALIYLYTDLMLLYYRRDSIRKKMDSFPEFASSFTEQERARTAPFKNELQRLSAISRELKLNFKEGRMSETDYKKERRKIHDGMSALSKDATEKKPFDIMFEQELRLCKYALDGKALIEAVLTMTT